MRNLPVTMVLAPFRPIARLGAALVVIAAGVAVVGTSVLAAVDSANPAASIALFAVDTDPTGNSPRSVGTVEQCVSANVGQPAQIDIVVPGAGIPANRAIGAYQFTFLYDPAVIWIGADDSGMLLAQAGGSNVIPIADPIPDRNGIYESWGVDFGPSGIEPAGSSETGPGVIARITLLPQSQGVSTLTLSDVLVIDDASGRISLESIQSATINVGQSCSSESVTPLSPTPALVANPTVLPRSTPSAETFPPDTGSPFSPSGGSQPLLIATGLLTMLGGLSLLICNMSARSSKARGQ